MEDFGGNSEGFIGVAEVLAVRASKIGITTDFG